MSSKPPPYSKSKDEEATDLGSLWTKAVNDYLKQTGKSLTQDMRARSIQDVMSSTQKNMESFQGFRHKGDKVDKVRSAFGRHLDGMQKCMQGIEMVGAMAGAFPPAMPVGLVFAACGHLLAAFAGVKADYDRVEEFFNHSGRFFERLSIIENKGADSGALGKAIVRVFSAQLSICAIVEVMTAKGGRFKQWLSALWNMQDPDLAAAYGMMQQSIEELAQTVGYASYAEIKSTQAITVTISAQADKIDAEIQRFRSEQGRDMQMMYEEQVQTRLLLEDGFRTTHDGIEKTQALIKEEAEKRAKQEAERHAQLVKLIQGEKARPEDAEKDKRKQTTKGGGKGDPGDKKYKALRSIKAYFDSNIGIFPLWRDAYKENAAQDADVGESYVPGTAKWLSSDVDFQQWIEGKKPLLWMKGPDGIGKSFLAHASLRKAREGSDGNSSFAYFYFKEDFPYLQSAQNAFACTALQIAEANTRYAEQIAAKLKEDSSASMTTWERFFFSVFGESSKASSTSSNDSLYLIFDGLDEAREEQKEEFMTFLNELMQTKSRVRVLVTSRPEENQIAELEPLVVEVTKAKILPDMKALIWERLHSLSRLKKFSRASKKIVRKKVAKQADSMLYVEHMLRRLSYIGREGAVLKDLDKMPTSLPDLYKLMLDECRRDRSEKQYEALKRLFAWLAYSRRGLSLAEASELVKLTVADDHFDIEDELIGRSARILELTRTRRVDNDQDVKDSDDEEGEDEIPPVDEYRSAGLTFQERSLRQYFRAVSVEGHEDLRTPSSSAHLTILKMCVDILVKSAEIMKENDYATDDGTSELRAYAIKYWYEHLNELDLESASADEVCQVLGSVYRVVNNQSNVARLFERYAIESEIYPDREDTSVTLWYDQLKAWIERGSSIMSDLPDSALGRDVKDWIRHVSAEPDSVLLPLAKGHINNWRTKIRRWNIHDGYAFARKAQKLSGRSKTFENDVLGEILFVAEEDDESKLSAQTSRSVGASLLCIGDDTDDSEVAITLFEKALLYLERSIEQFEQLPNQNLAKGYAQDMLAMAQGRLGNNQAAIDMSKKALATLRTPGEPIHDAAFREYIIFMYIDQAQWHWRLEDRDAALEGYNEARRIAEGAGETIYSWYLDEITTLLEDEKTDPDGHRLMETLRSWSEKERRLWFEYCLEYWVDQSALARMYRAAKLTGETALVVEWLEAFAKTLDPQSLTLFNVKSAIADFWNKVLGESDKAKEMMRSILDHPPKNDEDVLNERISAVRIELAGIIFSQFRSSADPVRKDALLAEMKTLPGMKTEDEFKESHIGMLLANMYRIMGPAREYQASMDRIFKTCIDGLEDNVQWNDGDSLRLLAKVLSSLDGLEKDARITISSQFSVMDRTIFADFNGSASSSERGADEGSEPERSENVEEAVMTESAEKGAAAANPDGHVEDSDAAIPAAAETSNEKHEENDAPTPIVAQIPGTEPEEPKGPTSTVPKDADGTSVDPEAPTEKSAEGSPAAAASNVDADKISAESSDDALYGDIGDYGIFCDGGCGTNIQKYTQPFYLCLICPNTDLCEACHSKRLAWNRGEGETAWKTFCGKNHHYIKGPMKDWRGIKDGVIRIGEEEIAVKDWIKGLKEERWPKAWERYWLRQGGLKDIDVSDEPSDSSAEEATESGKPGNVATEDAASPSESKTEEATLAESGGSERNEVSV